MDMTHPETTPKHDSSWRKNTHSVASLCIWSRYRQMSPAALKPASPCACYVMPAGANDRVSKLQDDRQQTYAAKILQVHVNCKQESGCQRPIARQYACHGVCCATAGLSRHNKTLRFVQQTVPGIPTVQLDGHCRQSAAAGLLSSCHVLPTVFGM